MTLQALVRRLINTSYIFIKKKIIYIFLYEFIIINLPKIIINQLIV